MMPALGAADTATGLPFDDDIPSRAAHVSIPS
jgi:hypothetical protein